MVTRTGLLALAAVFALPVCAQELQVTLSGEACMPIGNPCVAALFNGGSASGVTVSPFTISYLLNTSTAQLSQIAFGTSGSQTNVLLDFQANFPLTNYTETMGGQTTFVPHGSGGFTFETPGVGSYQLFGSASAGSNGFGFDKNAPLVTQAQYMSFSDPLAGMLFADTPVMLGGEATSNGWLLDGSATVRSVTVPTPGPMLLLLTGLFALTASHRSRFPILRWLLPSGRGGLGKPACERAA